MAGDEGFEPPITGPEPVALPLGQSPLMWLCTDNASNYSITGAESQ
jgi:hypothetical protein